MKKLFFSFIAAISAISVNAQQDFIGTNWNEASLSSLSKEVILPVAASYHLKQFNISDKQESATYEFGSGDNSIKVELKKELVNVDSDLAKKGEPVVSEVIVKGFFPDVFNIYKALFNESADLEQIKVKGSAAPIITSDKKSVAFYRGSGASYGSWIIRIRKA